MDAIRDGGVCFDVTMIMDTQAYRKPLSRVEGSSTRARKAAGGIRGPRLPSGEFAEGKSDR